MKDSLREPNIERLLTTLQGGIPDRVPHYEILIESRNVRHLLGKDVGSTMASSRGISDSAFFTPPMDPEDYLDICRRTCQDTMTLEALWTPLKYKGESGELRVVTDGRLTDWESLDKAIKPDWELDLQPRREVIRRYIKAAEGTNIGVTLVLGAVFQCCYYFLCKFDEFLLKIYTDRPFVEALMDICVDYYIRVAEMAIDEGIDILFVADDIAFKSGVFIDPEMLKELWMPRMERIMESGRSAGLPIMFHSCGNVSGIIDDVIMKMPIDCLNPIEPYSMDIFDIKKRYGKDLTLSGNIDIAGPLAFGTPEEVREDVRDHLVRLKPGGRYILSTNHSVTDDIDPRNYQAMVETCLEFGAY
ncbi:MAG: uroporphyrinogen decarboxylase family protein [bacterium]